MIKTLTALHAALNAHDWSYQFSDDRIWYNKGREEAATIAQLMKEATAMGYGAMADQLYHHYNPYSETKPFVPATLESFQDALKQLQQ